MDLKSFVESFIGKTLEEAQDLANFNGYTIRLRKRDGDSFLGTSDLKQTRVNLHLETNKVVQANIG